MHRTSIYSLCCAVLFASLALVSGCQKQHLAKEAVSGLADDPYPVAPDNLARSIRILVWPDTIIDEVKVAFEKRYDVKVVIDTFSTNDEAYSSLLKNPTKWDLVMVSQYMADRMMRDKMLIPVQRINEYIYRYIDVSVLNPKADPHMKYYIPFDYTALGVSFNVKYMAGFPRQWGYLVDHKDNPYIYGRIALPDDMRYALATAFLVNGVDPANATLEDLEVAKKMLIANVKEFGLKFVPDPKIKSAMVDQDVIMAITWSAEAAGILKERPDCRFLIPEGKSILTVDGFSIPKGAPSPQTATLFIEFMLHPYNSLLVANRTLYASVNMRSMKHADRFVINGPSCMLPPPQDRVHMKALNGEELVMYEKAWAQIKEAELDENKINLIPLK